MHLSQLVWPLAATLVVAMPPPSAKSEQKLSPGRDQWVGKSAVDALGSVRQPQHDKWIDLASSMRSRRTSPQANWQKQRSDDTISRGSSTPGHQQSAQRLNKVLAKDKARPSNFPAYDGRTQIICMPMNAACSKCSDPKQAGVPAMPDILTQMLSKQLKPKEVVQRQGELLDTSYKYDMEMKSALNNCAYKCGATYGACKATARQKSMVLAATKRPSQMKARPRPQAARPNKENPLVAKLKKFFGVSSPANSPAQANSPVQTQQGYSVIKPQQQKPAVQPKQADQAAYRQSESGTAGED